MQLNSDSEFITVMLYHYISNYTSKHPSRSHRCVCSDLSFFRRQSFRPVLPLQADINVVASIKPLHSLVAAVMEGVGTYLIVEGAGSPHTYALKPSQAGNLQNADLVFWIGDRLETFLEKPIEDRHKGKIGVIGRVTRLNQIKFRKAGRSTRTVMSMTSMTSMAMTITVTTIMPRTSMTSMAMTRRSWSRRSCRGQA